MSAPSSVNVSGSILSARRSPGLPTPRVRPGVAQVCGASSAISNYLTGTYMYRTVCSQPSSCVHERTGAPSPRLADLCAGRPPTVCRTTGQEGAWYMY